MMDVEKLIKRLRKYTYWLGQSGPESHDIHPVICDEAATVLSMLQAENEKMRAKLERVKRENDALWTYIEIVDREYRRYMDRGYIDRLDELRKTWKCGQKED